MLGNRAAIALALEESGVDPNEMPFALKAAQVWIGRLQSRNDAALALDALVERVDLSRGGIRVSLKLPLPSIGASVASARDGAAPNSPAKLLGLKRSPRTAKADTIAPPIANRSSISFMSVANGPGDINSQIQRYDFNGGCS